MKQRWQSVFPIMLMLVIYSYTQMASAQSILPANPTQRNVATQSKQLKLPSADLKATDLKFRDFFKMPIGPYGLEPTEKLLTLDGKPVHIIGYMAKDEEAHRGLFILSPLPVSLGHEDESLANDLPPNALFVHTGQDTIPYIAGLIELRGTLNVGAQEETSGHVSSVRLMLEPATIQKLKKQAMAGRSSLPAGINTHKPQALISPLAY